MKRYVHAVSDLSQLELSEVEDLGYKLVEMVPKFKADPYPYFKNQMKRKYGPDTEVFVDKSEVTGQCWYQVYAKIDDTEVISSSKDLSKKFHPSFPDADEDEMFEVGNVIDAVTYQTWDNYRYDENADYNYILDVIKEHLEDPDTYGLKAGVDFDDEDVAERMDDYDWRYINENRSVGRWIAEDLGK